MVVIGADQTSSWFSGLSSIDHGRQSQRLRNGQRRVQRQIDRLIQDPSMSGSLVRQNQNAHRSETGYRSGIV